MNILETKIQYYPAKIYITEPLGELTIEQLILSTKNPKDSIKEVFNKIAKAEKEGDMDEKAKLKTEKLFYVNPAVVLDGKGRKYSNIKNFTGIAPLDFDHLEDAHEFRDIVFERFKSVIAAYLSPSKKGVKFLVRIPICSSVEEYKSYVYGLGYYFQRFKGWDGSVQNAVLPLFISWDEDIKWRSDAEVWTQQGIKIDEFKAVKHIIQKTIDKADEEKNGHPNVRAAGLISGGYFIAGYMTEDEMKNHLLTCIENSDYLRKNIRGYKKTALQMFEKGKKAPLYLSKDEQTK